VNACYAWNIVSNCSKWFVRIPGMSDDALHSCFQRIRQHAWQRVAERSRLGAQGTPEHTIWAALTLIRRPLSIAQ